MKKPLNAETAINEILKDISSLQYVIRILEESMSKDPEEPEYKEKREYQERLLKGQFQRLKCYKEKLVEKLRNEHLRKLKESYFKAYKDF